MKNTRKLLLLLLCLAMLLMAVGCGEELYRDKDDAQTGDEHRTTTSISTTEKETTTAHGITTTTKPETTTTATDTTTEATTTTTQQTAALTDEEMIVGQWEARIALGDALNAQAAETGTGDFFNFEGLEVILSYEFKEDGTTAMAMMADEEFAEQLKAVYLNGMEAYLQTLMSDAGYASVDVFCQMMGCDTLEDLYEKMAATLADGTTVALSAATQEGTYRFADSYLHLEDSATGAEEVYNYTLTSTRLLLNYIGEETEENDSVLQTLMPLTFKKVG